MYKHDENVIDPRDKHLVSYTPEKKKFVTEASSLKGSGIEPTSHHYTIGGPKWIIFMWSEKFQLHITYVWNRAVKHGDEVVADVFVPKFDMIVTLNEHRAHAASMGSELHILND